MTYKVRFFFAALFALLAGLAVIYHNEELLRVSLRVLDHVCGATSEPASPSTASWQPSPTQGNIQGTAGRLSDIWTASLSAPFAMSTPMMFKNQDQYSGSWSSNKEEHLTFICSSTSRSPGKLWLNGGMRLLEVAMSDTCKQELELKLCTMVALEPSATLQSTPRS